MAKKTTELEILITVTNQAKDAVTSVVQQLGDMQKTLDGLSSKKAEDSVNGGLDSMGQKVKEVDEALDKLGKSGERTTEPLSQGAEGVRKLGKQAEESVSPIEQLGRAFDRVGTLVRFVTGGFLAIQGVGMIKHLADTAARTETLGIVLQTVGQNAGYTSAQLTETDKAVQKLGITAESSRQSIAQLIQAGLAIDFAKPLARAAQDLAVISGVNSSETFQKLVVNIQQLDTQGLRFMGIMVDRERVFAQAAQETGKAISGSLQKTVFANAVLAEAAKLTGLYEASLQSAGKQLTSLPRYVENLQNALGRGLQPVYLQLILGTQNLLKALAQLADSFQKPAVNADLFGDSVDGAENSLSPLADSVRSISKLLVDMVNFIRENKNAFIELVTIIRDVIAVMILLNVATKTFVATTAFLTGLTAMGSLLNLIKVIGPAAALAITIFGRAATVAGASITIAWAPILLPILAVAAAIGGLIYLYDKLTGTAKKASDVQSKSAQELVDDYEGALAAQEALIRANNRAQDDLRKARNNEAANPKDQEVGKVARAAAKAASEASDALAKQNQKIQELRDALGNSAELKELDALKNKVKELDAASKERVKALTKETEAQQALSEALKQAGEDYGRYLNGIDNKTEEKIGTLRSQIEQLGRAKFSDLNSGLLSTLSFAEKISAAIETDQELDKLTASMESVREQAQKFGLDFSAPIKALLAQAASNVTTFKATVAAGGQAALNEANQTARRTAQIERDSLLSKAETRKIASQRALEIDKLFFDKGLTNLDNYYANRIQAVVEGLKDEQAAQLAFIKSETERKVLEPDTVKKIQIEKDIEAAKSKLRQQGDRADADIQRIQIERLNQRQQLQREVAEAAADVNRAQGNVEAAIRAENAAALDKELEKVKALGNADAENIVRRKAELNLNRQLAEERLDKLNRELSLRKSLLSLDEQVILLAQQRGEVGSLDADEALNDIIRARIVILQEEFDLTKKLRDEAFSDSRVAEGNVKNSKLVELQTEMASLIRSIKSVGDSIKASLTDSIASNFESIINRTKSFRQGMLDIFKDLNSQILKIATKNVAEDIVKGISGIGKGDKADGPSLFDKLASVVTGQPTKPAPELDKARQDAILKQNVANAAKEEKFVADALNKEAVSTAVKTTDFTRRTAEATEATLREIEKTGLKREEDAAKGLGKVGGGFTTGTDVGEVGGAAANQAFNFATALKQVGYKDKPLAVPAFNSEFDKAADSSGLRARGYDGDLLRFIAAKESKFDPNADSGKAKGLMQFTPATFEGLGFDRKDILDPVKSIQASAKLLNTLLDEFNGDLNKALAAYNAGPKVANARAAGDFSKQSASNRAQTDDYVAKLGTSGIGSKPVQSIASKTDPLPVQVVNTVSTPKYDELGNATGFSEEVAGPKRGGASGDWETAKEEIKKVGVASKEAVVQVQAKTEVERTAAIVKQAEVAKTEASTAALTQDTAKVVESTTVTDANNTAVSTTTTSLTTLGTAADAAAVALGKVGSGGAGGGAGSPSPLPETKTEGDQQDTAVAGLTKNLTPNKVEKGAGDATTNAFGIVQSFGPALGAAAGGKIGGQGGAVVGALLGTIFQKMDTSKLTQAITGNVQKGFDDVKAEADQGGLGIGSFFDGFSGVISKLFSGLSGGDGGGGGLGGLIGSIAGSLFGGGAGAEAAGSIFSNFLFADGGYVSGPGTGTSDSINARLSNGEYVMTAEKTTRFLPMLEAMRNGTLDGMLRGLTGSMRIDIPKGPNFAGGGYVSAGAGGTNMAGGRAPAPHITMNITTPDAGSFRKSQDQIAASTGHAVNRAMKRNS